MSQSNSYHCLVRVCSHVPREAIGTCVSASAREVVCNHSKRTLPPAVVSCCDTVSVREHHIAGTVHPPYGYGHSNLRPKFGSSQLHKGLCIGVCNVDNAPFYPQPYQYLGCNCMWLLRSKNSNGIMKDRTCSFDALGRTTYCLPALSHFRGTELTSAMATLMP